MSKPAAPLSADSRIARNEDVLFSEVADGMSLMDIESGKYFHFDTTGARIWKQIEGTVSIGEVCEKLQAEFEVDPATCKADTIEFVQELGGMDLIKITN